MLFEMTQPRLHKRAPRDPILQYLHIPEYTMGDYMWRCSGFLRVRRVPGIWWGLWGFALHFVFCIFGVFYDMFAFFV